MPDRVIRAELLRSDRWLDLPTDTHRLVYENLILIADDYGNLEGGPRRLYRWMHGFTQVKSEIDAIKLMSDLQDGDMVARYEVDGKEYWHLHRFKNSRKYWSRKFPTSPYTENTKLPSKQRVTENPNPNLTPIEPGLSRGVGVGELLSKNAPQSSPPSRRQKAPADTDAQLEVRRNTWQAYSDAYEFRHGAPPIRDAKANAAIKRFCSSVSADECVGVAQFYVQNSNSFYLSKMHPPTLLALDAAKLRTEWATQHQITQAEAQQADKTASRKSAFTTLISEAKKNEHNPQ